MNRAAKATAGVLTAAATMTAAYEGLYTHAYHDVVGVVTICYGETNADLPVHMGDTKTPQECRYLLANSLKKYDAELTACLTHNPPDGMHVVFISFTYNVGTGAFCKSSVARKFNEGDLEGSCNALRLYNRAGGRVIKGLDNRRKGEQESCLKAIHEPPPTVTVKVDIPEPAPMPDRNVDPDRHWWDIFNR